MTSRVFEASGRAGRKRLWTAMGVAVVLAPVFGYFIGGFSISLWLLAIAGGAMLLAVVIYLLRSFWWIDRIVIDETSISIHRKEKILSVVWDEVREIEFQSLNGTPWLFLRTKEKAGNINKMFCLDNMEDLAIEELSDMIANKIPGKIIISQEWIIANRIPVTTSKKRR